MSDFDILSLLEFKPAKYLCVNCHALLKDEDLVNFVESDGSVHFECPICEAAYADIFARSKKPAFSFFQSIDSLVKLDDTARHSYKLARIVYDFQKGAYTPKEALYEILSTASCFVHFVTYGISMNILQDFIRETSPDVSIRGLIANVKEQQVRQLKSLQQAQGAKRLDLHLYKESDFQKHSHNDPPHQKIIVVDGLLAFVGSVNLTNAGWRKSNKRREFLDIVTNVSKVQTYHNELFSSIWAEDKPGQLFSYIRVKPLERNWDSDTPVRIVGVEDGRITKNGSGYQDFANLDEAKCVFAELDPYQNTENFTWAMLDTFHNSTKCMRFETWSYYNLMFD